MTPEAPGDVSEAFVAQFMQLPVRAGSIAAFLVGFVILSTLFLLFFERKKAGPLSPKSIWNYIFRKDLYRNATTRADIWNFFFVYILWVPVLGVIGATIVGLDLGHRLTGLLGEFPYPVSEATVAIIIQTIVIFMFMDLGFYCIHYLFHKVPLLWSLHRVHHSAEALTIFTSQREHPLELAFTVMVGTIFGGVGGGVAMYFTGMPIGATTTATLAGLQLFKFIGPEFFRHSHMRVSYGPLNRIFNAPVMHQFHHSAEPRHWNKNMGGELMIWDWLFGTLYLPQKDEVYRWGLAEEELGASNPHVRVRDFYLEPFRYSYGLLARKRRLPLPRPQTGPAIQQLEPHHAANDLSARATGTMAG